VLLCEHDQLLFGAAELQAGFVVSRGVKSDATYLVLSALRKKRRRSRTLEGLKAALKASIKPHGSGALTVGGLGSDGPPSSAAVAAAADLLVAVSAGAAVGCETRRRDDIARLSRQTRVPRLLCRSLCERGKRGGIRRRTRDHRHSV
jgi:hypothetical protein